MDATFWQKKHKYGAQRTVVDGISFASKAEAARYCELKLLERAGEITKLELQPSFTLTVEGEKICVYKADFSYVRHGQSGKTVVEDVKGKRTAEYELKRKLFNALYKRDGLRVQEVVRGKVVDPDAPKPRRRRRKGHLLTGGTNGRSDKQRV